MEYLRTGRPTDAHPAGCREICLKALADHPEIDLEYGYLNSCLSLARQCGVLPPSIFGALSFSQHRQLFALHNPTEKVRLAQKAVDEGLDAERLGAEVQRSIRTARSLTGKRGPGRPRLPAKVKVARKLSGLVSSLVMSVGDEESFYEHFGTEGIGELVDCLRERADALEELSRRCSGNDRAGSAPARDTEVSAP